MDQDFIAGCRRGERKAQEQLYKSYYTVMINLCLRYTKNNEDAIEVLNRGFLKVFVNIKRYDPGKASLYTWIRTIVINSCLDFLKQKERYVIHEAIENVQDDYHIDADAINKINVEELLAFVRQLPAATMAVFNLYIMEGHTHKEIAILLDISEGTSKWQLNEARKKLKQMIRLQEVKI